MSEIRTPMRGVAAAGWGAIRRRGRRIAARHPELTDRIASAIDDWCRRPWKDLGARRVLRDVRRLERDAAGPRGEAGALTPEFRAFVARMQSAHPEPAQPSAPLHRRMQSGGG